MKVFGLTGKTGAGKSSVAKILAENGFSVIDGDEIAREIVAKGSPVLKKLSDSFGEDIIFPDGSLDRKKLASRAFADERSRKELNAITHGEIDRVIRERLEESEKNGFGAAVIDAAALLESPSRELCEKMIVVFAERETRLKRILERDGISEEEALRRMNAQKSDEYYLSNADFVIHNVDRFLEKKVLELIDELKGKE